MTLGVYPGRTLSNDHMKFLDDRLAMSEEERFVEDYFARWRAAQKEKEKEAQENPATPS